MSFSTHTKKSKDGGWATSKLAQWSFRGINPVHYRFFSLLKEVTNVILYLIVKMIVIHNKPELVFRE